MLKLRWWGRMCKADESRLLSVVFRRRYAAVVRGEGRLSGLLSMRSLLVECGLESFWLNKSCTVEDGSWEHHAAVVMERCAQDDEQAVLLRILRSEFIPGWISLT